MPSTDPFVRHPRSWARKFGEAFAGIWLGVRGQSSFVVHGVIAVAVIGAASFFAVERWEWCVLGLCIGMVLLAELFNSALETLARAVDPRENRLVGQALEIASGAVLLGALTAGVIGVVIFWPHVSAWFGR